MRFAVDDRVAYPPGRLGTVVATEVFDGNEFVTIDYDNGEASLVRPESVEPAPLNPSGQ